MTNMTDTPWGTRHKQTTAYPINITFSTKQITTCKIYFIEEKTKHPGLKQIILSHNSIKRIIKSKLKAERLDCLQRISQWKN